MHFKNSFPFSERPEKRGLWAMLPLILVTFRVNEEKEVLVAVHYFIAAE